MSELEIRTERAAEVAAIGSLTIRAFKDMPYAGGDEQDVIVRLREVGALSVSLVAVLNDEIVGHIAFSPAEIEDASGPWFALGPVSVLPDYQRSGIGSALINEGLELIAERGALGCILTGNPDYYQRFGFALAPEHVPSGEPPEYFMLKRFAGSQPGGHFVFHPAFYGEV
ncbi:MAG: N-acetyltransferase [Pseudomonadota bacterium]